LQRDYRHEDCESLASGYSALPEISKGRLTISRYSMNETVRLTFRDLMVLFVLWLTTIGLFGFSYLTEQLFRSF
jgi:hypothetical protein